MRTTKWIALLLTLCVFGYIDRGRSVRKNTPKIDSFQLYYSKFMKCGNGWDSCRKIGNKALADSFLDQELYFDSIMLTHIHASGD